MDLREVHRRKKALDDAETMLPAARRRRPHYPSDQRRYFRVVSADLADETAHLTDAEFRAFVLILAEANEKKAQLRGDSVAIARSRLLSVSPNGRQSVAKASRTVRELCAKQNWKLTEDDLSWTIQIRNWSYYQGFAPTSLRSDSDESPGPTPTTTPTPRREEARAKSEGKGTRKKGPPEPSAEVMATWPQMVEAAARYGVRWMARPGVEQAKKVQRRIDQGATPDMLVAAIHGYVAQNGTAERDGFKPLDYLRVDTLYGTSKFEDYATRGLALEEPGESLVERTQRLEREHAESVRTGRVKDAQGF